MKIEIRRAVVECFPGAACRYAFYVTMASALFGTASSMPSEPDAVAAPLDLATLAARARLGEAAPNGPLSQLFASPPKGARPRVRFWLPQAAVTEGGLRRDIAILARQGYGEVEIVAMRAPAGVPAQYAWGTPRWDKVMAVILDEAAKRGLTTSFTNGPAWPIAMPAVRSADDPASLYELTYGIEVLEPGQHFDGRVPPRRTRHDEGAPHLIAVLAYRMTDAHTLDQASVRDLTSAVVRDSGAADDGRLKFDVPAGDARWILLSFWEQPAAQKVNDLYVIDHLAAAGAKASAAYWNATFTALKGEGAIANIFNDSMEYHVAMDWTRNFRAIFQARHRYDITPYLPFIGFAKTFPQSDIPGFASADAALGQRVNQDYLATLTALYMTEHLGPLEEMARRHGATIRYQVGYNKPYDVETVGLAVGIPETEALGRGALDGLRQMAGAVHLTGKPFYSFEASAEFGNDSGQTFRDILWWNKRAWAAGINMQTLHGASYSGWYDGPGNVAGYLPGIAWPGYSAFGGMVSNNWNRAVSEPLLRRVTDYLARVNFVMQKPAKVDVAIYRHGLDSFNDQSARHGDGETLYPDAGVLNGAGFSYDFLTASLLGLPAAAVRDGRLAPEGPSYKALVVPNQQAIALTTLNVLARMAGAGLKIVFVGALPQRGLSEADRRSGETDAQVRASTAALLAMPGVASVAGYAEVPAALRTLAVRPDADVAAPSDILAQRRSDNSGDFYYLYNYNKVSSKDAVHNFDSSSDGTSYPYMDEQASFQVKTVTFALSGTGKPYLLNPWAGTIKPLPAYTVHDGRVEVTLRFGRDEALIVGILDDAQAADAGIGPAARHATAAVPANVDVVQGPRGLAVRARANGPIDTPVAGAGTVRTLARNALSGLTVRDWTLRIDAIGPDKDASPSFHSSRHRQMGPFAVGARLQPWAAIDPALARVAGIGSYAGSFTLPATFAEADGAYLVIGKTDDVAGIAVNGVELSGFDPLAEKVDIGRLVKPGRNVVVIRVASTLYNTLHFDSAGTSPMFEGAFRVRQAPLQAYGLLGIEGEVRIEPYRAYLLNPAGVVGDLKAGGE